MRWSLPALAINRPVSMAMLILTLLCMGGIAWHLTPLEFLPRIDVPVLVAHIPYPGAAPRQVEKEIAIPAEGEFKTIPGMDRISTRSYEGHCTVVMRFGWETDMSLAAADLRDRIERLKLRLPPEIDRIMIRRFSSDQEPILRFALFREVGQDELARAVRRILRNRLLRIEGVADVHVSGRESEQVYVDFDQEALRSLNLAIYQVVQSLQTSSINLIAGELMDGERKYYVRTIGEFADPDELAEVVVSPNGIRLKDVASVEMLPPAGASSFSIDGNQGVFLSVQKESEANTVATCKAIHAELELIKEDPLFRGVEIFIFDDLGEVVRFAMSTLMKAGKYGSLLAFLVLLFSLRRFRPTLIVALTTPTSIVAALVFIYFSGRSLNLVTMSALLVSIGMLVDNSIVVIENIQRHHRLGPDRRANARRGASEVALAITASTLTTIVVFVPVIYMEAGELSWFMKEFSGPMTAALLASLVMALTLLPLAESRGGHGSHHYLARLRTKLEKLPPLVWAFKGMDVIGAIHPFNWARACYGPLLKAVISHRLPAVLFLSALLALTFFIPFQHVGMQEMPSMDMRQVVLHMNTDQNYGAEEVKKTVKDIVAIIDQHRDALGIENIYLDQWGTGAYIRAFLVKPEDLPAGDTPPFTTEEVRNILAELLPDRFPGARMNFGISSTTPSDLKTVTVRLRGDDTDTLDDLAEQFCIQMRNSPEINKARTDRDESQEEIQLHIDEPKTAAVGTSPSIVAQTVSFALSGRRLPYMKKEGREISVWARFQGEDRRTTGDLENVSVQSNTGQLVPLSQLVEMQHAPVTRRVYRENGKSMTSVSGETVEKDLTQVREELKVLADNFQMPKGYSLSLGDEIKNIDDNLRNFRSALLLSVILIYLVMSALFESILLPLSILTSVALAFVGVYWSMFMTNTPMDTVALIGAVLMCGIIVNNGIVIVDHINQLRRSGIRRHDAILQAGYDRFRPVLMTSLTTILGCLPLAIGGGTNASALQSLGRALVGGLSAGTVLTLVIVPLVYTLIDDLQDWAICFLGNLMGLKTKRGA